MESSMEKSPSLATPPEYDLQVDIEEAYESWQQTKPEQIAIDTETEGLGYHDRPFCVTLAWEDVFGTVEAHYGELGIADDLLGEILMGSREWIFHNAKFDLQKLQLAGFTIQGREIHDTECLAHLIDENRPKRLKFLARELLGEETDEEEVLKVARRKHKLRKTDGYHLLPREVLIPYARKDAEYTYRLFQILSSQLPSSLHDLYKSEMELTKVLLEVESRGFNVDVPYLERVQRDYTHKIVEATVKIRRLTGKEDLNVRSPAQLRDAFAERGIETESTDKASLRGLGDPLADAVLETRIYSKLLGTYIEPILREQRDGILHPSYRQHGTRTGRLSSGAAEQ